MHGCSDCSPAGSFPNPNDRGRSGRSFQINNPHRSHRRNTFFDRRVYRASELVQNPRSMSLREFAIIIFLAYAVVYRVILLGGDLNELFVVRPVGEICPGRNAIGCVWTYIKYLWYLVLYEWAAAVGPWAIVGAVSVFLGEEALGAIRGKK